MVEIIDTAPFSSKRRIRCSSITGPSTQRSSVSNRADGLAARTEPRSFTSATAVRHSPFVRADKGDQSVRQRASPAEVIVTADELLVVSLVTDSETQSG